MDIDIETFVVHEAIKKLEKMPMHSKKQAQIQNKAQVGVLILNETLTAVSIEYFNYSNIFLMEYKQNF